MNFITLKAKVFAVPFLIFASLFSAFGQTGPGDSIYRLPIGTRIKLAMDAGISSKISSVNDTFTASVASAIAVENVVILPAGTIVEGRVLRVERADIGRKNGEMELRFETIRFSPGRKRTINGILADELRPPSTRTSSILSIFGGTAAGALAGAAAAKKTGALAGAGVGAGIGTAAVFIRKGKDVAIKTGEKFEIVLKSEVTLPATDY